MAMKLSEAEGLNKEMIQEIKDLQDEMEALKFMVIEVGSASTPRSLIPFRTAWLRELIHIINMGKPGWVQNYHTLEKLEGARACTQSLLTTFHVLQHSIQYNTGFLHLRPIVASRWLKRGGNKMATSNCL